MDSVKSRLPLVVPKCQCSYQVKCWQVVQPSQEKMLRHQSYSASVSKSRIRKKNFFCGFIFKTTFLSIFFKTTNFIFRSTKSLLSFWNNHLKIPFGIKRPILTTGPSVKWCFWLVVSYQSLIVFLHSFKLCRFMSYLLLNQITVSFKSDFKIDLSFFNNWTSVIRMDNLGLEISTQIGNIIILRQEI